MPGIGPKTEARLLEALAREAEPRPRRGLLLNRARELVAGIAAALGGEAAGDVRRWRDSCELLAVVCAAPDPSADAGALRRAAADRRGDRAGASGARVGVTVEGVPVELVVAEPRAVRDRARARDRLAGVRRARSSRCRTRPTRRRVYRALGLPWCPPELREEPFRGEPPALVEPDDIRGDLHCHTTWSDGRASVEEMGRAARERGYEYLAICDHTPAVGAVRGLTADDVRRQAEEIAAANDAPGAVPRPARDRVRHPRPTAGSTFPTTCSPSSTGCRRACTAASGCRDAR